MTDRHGSVVSSKCWHSHNIFPEHSIFHTESEDFSQSCLKESGRHSDRFVVKNSFSLYENQNKLAGAMLRISDMWFPVKEKN